LFHQRPKDDDCDPEKYLKDSDNRFLFDLESGIYKPKAYYKKEKRNKFKLLSLSLFQWGTLFLSAATLVFLIKYTNYARLQWCEMKRTADQSVIAATAASNSAIEAKNANQTTKAALIDVQRAFVFLGTVTATAVGNNQADFYFPMENSGTTPTKDMRMHVNYQSMKDPLPDNFEFPDLWIAGMPKVNRHTMIGPKGNTGQHLGPISNVLVQAAIHRQIHLYFWGWARYRDVFPDTPLHVTKFCAELVPVGQGEEITPSTTTLRFSLDMCERNNCYDEECKGK
jgi:hypothetical protein